MTTTIEKTSLRKKILAACMKKQQTLIDDFSTRTKALLETHGLGNEDEYDNNQLSHQSETAHEINTLRDMIKLVTEEMDTLIFLNSNAAAHHEVAEPGAVVITNRSKFFISVSIEQIQVDREQYIGISTMSPMYKAMKGLGRNKQFMCKGISYKILDVF